MPLPKECKKCGRRFQPSSYANKLCDDCRNKANNEWRVKKSDETRRKNKK